MHSLTTSASRVRLRRSPRAMITARERTRELSNVSTGRTHCPMRTRTSLTSSSDPPSGRRHPWQTIPLDPDTPPSRRPHNSTRGRGVTRMSTTQSERLRGLLEPLVSTQGLDLEEIEVTPAGQAARAARRRRLRRRASDLDACAELSRALSEKLDETRRDGRGRVRPRGDLARRRPPADRAPALSCAPSAGWSRSS